MNLNHLNVEFKLDTKALKDDGEYFTFQGYASTFGNPDLGDDIVVENAFSASLKARKPKLLYQHDARQPIGVIDETMEDGKGLFIKARMPKQNTLASDVAALIQCGAVDSMSIGFMINDYEIKNGMRYIKTAELYEVSVVTFPMNPKAMITESKGVSPGDFPLADEDREWDKEGAMKRVRDHTDSEDEPSADYKKYFMYFDSEYPKDFTSYKLPFVDIINGKPYAVPRAIFAVAAALRGARGGVKISDSDKSKIKTKLSSYYKKMDKPDPFEEGEKSIYTPIFFQEDVEKISTKREFEQCLRESGLFSKQAAITLSSKFLSQSDSDTDTKEDDNLNQKAEILTGLQTLLDKLKG